jgi:acyl-CoA thioesterase
MWHHYPLVAVDKWLVSERETSWGAGRSAIITQRVWDLKSGQLALTCIQEALIRLKDRASKI